MKKALFTLLWMLAAFLLGCIAFLVFLTVAGLILEARGVSLSTPNQKRPILVLVNILMVYGPPAIALILGIRGVLPGTRNEKPSSAGPIAAASSPPPITQTSLSPTPPPVISPPQGGASQLSRDQIAAGLERAVQKKFGPDRSLLNPDLFEALLLCVIDKKTFNLIAAQSGRPSEQDVTAFEQTVGFHLPEDYRSFAMSGFGCLFLEVNENIWPRPKPRVIVPAWHMKYRIYVYGFSADVPDYMDIKKQFAAFSQGTHRIVPFLRHEGFLDHYCFTPDRSIVLWDAETRRTEPVDLTFTALLLKEIDTLEARAKRIQNEPNPYA